MENEKMKKETNPFGGKNKYSLYVPMTDDELEVLGRLAEAGEYKVVIKDWGYVTGFTLQRFNPETWQGNPIVVFGDKRISFYFQLRFNAPVIPQPNYYFDMELWARGHKLFAQRLPTETMGNPIQICAGMSLTLALDVAIDQIDPKIVKEVKPGTIGLTTRQGNMHLDTHHKKLLDNLKASEKKVRDETVAEAIAATQKMNKVIRGK
jgi:hypothetical protein